MIDIEYGLAMAAAGIAGIAAADKLGELFGLVGAHFDVIADALRLLLLL